MTTSRVIIPAAAAAAALGLAAVSGCAGGYPPAKIETADFASEAWGIALRYPVEWEATPGQGWYPLVAEFRAPGRQETIGAAVSVVGAWSAATLDEAAAAYVKGLPVGAKPVTSDLVVSGWPARAIRYADAQGSFAVSTRALLIRAPERYFVVTFAAYGPQRETVKPYFDLIEKSIRIK